MISIFAVLMFTLTTEAQEIKVKKGIVYVDNVATLKINTDYGNEIVTTMDGKDLMKIETVTYDIPNPARNNVSDPNRYSYPATVKRSYHLVSFIDANISFETNLSEKNIFEAIMKDQVIEKDGSIHVEKAERLAKKVHKNISGTRPNVVLIQN